eukprot:scaffold3109_cov56-Phaeocystis_antarctica.AAC.2
MIERARRAGDAVEAGPASSTRRVAVDRRLGGGVAEARATLGARRQRALELLSELKLLPQHVGAREVQLVPPPRGLPRRLVYLLLQAGLLLAPSLGSAFPLGGVALRARELLVLLVAPRLERAAAALGRAQHLVRLGLGLELASSTSFVSARVRVRARARARDRVRVRVRVSTSSVSARARVRVRVRARARDRVRIRVSTSSVSATRRRCAAASPCAASSSASLCTSRPCKVAALACTPSSCAVTATRCS